MIRSGRGRWTRYTKRLTTSDCLTLDIANFRGRLRANTQGKLDWTWRSGRVMIVEYVVHRESSAPIILLGYLSDDTLEIITIPVTLQSTPTNFGGERWWFTCPILNNDEPCGARVGKLYLPLGAKYFACRRCHALTYESCQLSHSDRRVLASIGATGYEGLKRLREAYARMGWGYHG